MPGRLLGVRKGIMTTKQHARATARTSNTRRNVTPHSSLALGHSIDVFAERLLLAVVLGALALFVLYPMACLVVQSFSGSGSTTAHGFTLAAYGKTLAKYQGDLVNSVVSATGTAALCTIMSVACALTVASARGWRHSLGKLVLLITLVAPPFVTSLAYIQLFGRRGWITNGLLGLSWDPYGIGGVVVMQSVSFVPLTALFLIGMLDKLDAGSVRAARDLGARPAGVLRTVVLPLMAPGILVSLLLSFIRSLADFGTPIIIGGRFSTLAADIYLQLVGYSDLGVSAAMCMFLFVPGLAAFFAYRRLLLRCDRLASTQRSGSQRLDLKLSRCGVVGWLALAIAALFFAAMVLQYACIFASGFLKSSHGSYSFTLQHWNALWRTDTSTMVRSVAYALIIGVVGTLFALLVAYFVNRRNIPGKNVIDAVATLPYMLPGPCFGIMYILAFNHPPLAITGTAVIVLANMLFKQLPTTSKLMSAALANMPRELEASVRDLGGGRLAVIRDAVLPCIRPALISSFAYNFSTSMVTAGAVLFLISPSEKLAVFKLFDAVYTGDYAAASLVASVIIVITLAVEGAAGLATRLFEKRRSA